MKRKQLLKKSIAMLVLSVTVMSNSVLVMAAEAEETGGVIGNGIESTMLQDENEQEENMEGAQEGIQLEEENSQLEEESGIVDKNAPELKNITLGATSVAAPGSIEVTMEATDDISGVDWGSVSFRSNNHSQSVSLSRTYWNSENNRYEAYEDGKLHGKMDIRADSAVGEYKIYNVSVTDVVGNRKDYYNPEYYSSTNRIPDNVKNLAFTITSRQETVAPVFESVTLSTQSVTAPGKIDVIAKLSKDNNDISSISVSFESKGMSERHGRESVSAYLLKQDNSQEYTGTIELGEYTYPDEYTFEHIWISYKNGTSRLYSVESPELKDEIKNLTIKVQNDKLDKTAPELKGIMLGAESVSVPGVIDITVEASDDMSGVRYCSLGFMNKKNDKYIWINGSASDTYQDINYDYVKYEDGKLHGQIQVNQYQVSGEYVLYEISLSDYAGNECYYRNERYNENSYYSGYKIPDNMENISIKVVNDGETTDVTTSTGSADLVKDIRNAADNAVISVDITPNQKISKEVFDAIKGTNKTLLLNSDDIQWVFKGSDIVGQTKDIDLSGIVRHSLYDPSKDYYIGDIPAVGWEMGDNGELPGKATVRFLPSFRYREYLGTEGLYVYYFDSKTGELSLIASNLSMTNGNNIEFDITCCKEGVILVTKGMAKTDSTIPQGPETWKSKSGVESFVYRLYNVALSRDAETAGLADWTGRLNTKKENAAQVAWGIFFSPEFKNKCYTDAQFIEMLYQTMFGRTGDNGGKQYWLSLLEKGVSREYVYHGFAESQEFSNLCGSFGVERGSVALNAYRDQNPDATGFIARLYTKMLGRKFDEDGLEDWCKKYLTKENTIEEIASHGFLHSKELDNQNLSDEEFVIRMYETFLNREPEETGLKDWLGRLQRGEVTRDSIVYGFTNSQEFSNLKAEYNLP